MSGAEGPLRIAIAGGSIGGLCAGLAVRGVGFDVRVFERVSGPMETRGAGIVVQGELIELLRAHGAATLPTTRCTVRRYLSPEGGEGEVQRAPQDFTSWEAIYRTLAATFPSERYHRGAMLTNFGNGHGAVQAHIDGHGVGEEDVLPAADAAQSPPPPPALPAGPELDLRRLRRLARHARRGRRSARCRALLRRLVHFLRGALGRAHPGLFHPRRGRRHYLGKAPFELGLVRGCQRGRSTQDIGRSRRRPAQRVAPVRQYAG